jgi:hypothetical protein
MIHEIKKKSKSASSKEEGEDRHIAGKKSRLLTK